MKKLLSLAFGAFISIQSNGVSAQDTTSDDTLHFAFQVTRHGARAPTADDYGFTVPDGELTSSGMRQRFLLGDHNRKRYIEQYGLLDDKYNPEQMEVRTTLVDRTFQSGYSEMLGLYPPQSSGSQLTLIQARSTRLPTNFNVRDKKSLKQELGLNALPLGFVSVPIYSFIDMSNIHDDLDFPGCDYVNKVDGYNFGADATYTPVDWLLDDLRAPIAGMFNLTEQEEADMDFNNLYDYCDVIQSRLFEGVPLFYNFTDDQMTQCNQTVLAALCLPMNDPILSRTMYVSKQVHRARNHMKAIVEGKADGDDSGNGRMKEPNLKYLSYSMHDWTLAQHFLWNDATNGNFTVIPFASHIAYELHSDSNQENFWIEVLVNGYNYEFEECEEPTKCTWDEYQLLMQDVWVGTETGYVDECATEWNPPSQQTKFYTRN